MSACEVSPASGPHVQSVGLPGRRDGSPPALALQEGRHLPASLSITYAAAARDSVGRGTHAIATGLYQDS